MTVSFTDKTANDTLDGLDAFYNAGKVSFYTGAAPGANAVPTGTLLAQATIPADMWASAAGRAKALNAAIASAAAVAAGVIGYFRVTAAGDSGTATQAERREEGTATVTGGGGDMIVDNTNVAVGQVVTITQYTLTHP